MNHFNCYMHCHVYIYWSPFYKLTPWSHRVDWILVYTIYTFFTLYVMGFLLSVSHRGHILSTIFISSIIVCFIFICISSIFYFYHRAYMRISINLLHMIYIYSIELQFLIFFSANFELACMAVQFN